MQQGESTFLVQRDTIVWYASNMAIGPLPDHSGEELRREIISRLPYGSDWLQTPHELLGGQTPDEKIVAGDLQAVQNLVDSILYIGIS